MSATSASSPAAQELAGGIAGESGGNFAERLLEAGKLDAASMSRAQKLSAESDTPLVRMLVQLGLVSERDLADALAAEYGLRVMRAEDYPQSPLLAETISVEYLRRAQAVPVHVGDDYVEVAMADPSDREVVDALTLAMGIPVRSVVGTSADIERAIGVQFAEGASLDQEVEALGGEFEEGADDAQQLRDLASEAPIIRLVNRAIARALETRASDIHIEPFESKLAIRYRIDGVLRDVDAPPASSTAAVISRIKVMANLNIAERRLPQDGRVKLRIEGREVDMRVSTVPTMHGESVVMRILDKDSVPLDFAALGFDGEKLATFEKILNRPNGIILVTGPTGSGKTTSLYAALSRLNTPERKILTVEDPVEYQLPGINQIQIKPSIGLSFAQALRSILRQDPDVIMVGEMRDLETARIAVQSALTGHLVFSTLHTNDAPSSVTRLLDMGVEDYLVTSTVSAIVAQRLVRTLCPHCREPYPALPELVEELGLEAHTDARPPILFKPVGCEHCEHIGFRGRTTVIELLVMTDQVRRAIIGSGASTDIRAIAREAGCRSMLEDGLEKALRGITTIEEVERAVQDA